MSRFISVLAIVALMLAAAGCASQGARVGMTAEREVVKKQVQGYTLDNGATLIVKRTASGSPTAIQVWVSGGSLTDPEGKRGLAHLVEHVLFTGSRHVPKGRAEHYLECMGCDIVGHTGRDFSYMGATVPGPGWERAMDIIFDLVAYPSFEDEEFERQKKVVALEMSQEARDSDVLLMRNFFGEAYKVHPYRFPVTGLAGDIAGITLDDATSYYARTYVPSNMTVVVVGDVKAGAVKAMADKTFGSLAPVKYKRPGVPDEPGQLYSRTKSVTGPVKLAYMAIGWHVCAADDPDIYPLEVLRAVLGQGRGSRLYMELRERMGIVFDVDTDIFPMREPGVLVATAHLGEDDVRRVADEVLHQIDKLKDQQVSADELTRALNAIESSHMQGADTAEGQAYAIGYWTTVYGAKEPEGYMENIRKVTPGDVQRVAQKYLGEGNYTLSIIKPE